MTKTVLRVCVHEIRQALQEDPTAPQFIETVGREGYRFIAPLATQPGDNNQSPGAWRPSPSTLQSQPATNNRRLTTYFVGREPELAQLREFFGRARHGERQVVFVFGEPEIGKTALVDRFLDQVRANESVRIGRGQCIERQSHLKALVVQLPISL